MIRHLHSTRVISGPTLTKSKRFEMGENFIKLQNYWRYILVYCSVIVDEFSQGNKQMLNAMELSGQLKDEEEQNLT